MNAKPLATLALTTGEPAGIGPDLCVQIAQQSWPCRLIVIADSELIQARAQQLQLHLKLIDAATSAPKPHEAGSLHIVPIPLAAPARAGQLNPQNADYVLATLREAVQGCQSGRFDAMVTAQN